MDIQKKIEEAIENIIAHDSSLFLVEVVFNSKSKRPKLVVLLDGDEGITIDQCAEVSRELSGYLEENPLIEGAYTLEVSSPGVDMPIQFMRQYKRNIGRTLRFTFKDQEQLLARLKEVNETHLVVEEEKQIKYKKKYLEPISIAIDDIEKAVVQVSFK